MRTVWIVESFDYHSAWIVGCFDSEVGAREFAQPPEEFEVHRHFVARNVDEQTLIDAYENESGRKRSRWLRVRREKLEALEHQMREAGFDVPA